MKKKMAGFLLVCGVLLIFLGWFAWQADPSIAQVALLTGMAGGVLCALWGVLGLLGYRRRLWAGLTLGITNLVLVTQTVNGWLRPDEAQSGSHLAAVLITLMLLLSLALMTYVMHFGEGQPPSAAGNRAAQGSTKEPRRMSSVTSR